MDNSLTGYTLHLADTNLILAQRNAEWCGHGPILEQDIAITNISLDLLGQSRNFYQYAAKIINETKINGGSKAPSPPGEGVGGEVGSSHAAVRDGVVVALGGVLDEQLDVLLATLPEADRSTAEKAAAKWRVEMQTMK